MNVTIIALGSRGDVQPYIALAKGLESTGHHVNILALPPFEKCIRDAGVACHLLHGIDIEDVVKQISGQDRHLFHSPLHTLNYMASVMTAGMHEPDELGLDAFHDTDLIICSGLAMFLGLSIAEALRIKVLVASLQPAEVTAEFPHFLVTTRNLGPLGNRLTYLVGVLPWLRVRSTVNRWRQQVLGLPSFGWDPRQFFAAHEVIPHLCAFSQHLVAKPADWGSDVTITGYWFLDHASFLNLHDYFLSV